MKQWQFEEQLDAIYASERFNGPGNVMSASLRERLVRIAGEFFEQERLRLLEALQAAELQANKVQANRKSEDELRRDESWAGCKDDRCFNGGT